MSGESTCRHCGVHIVRQTTSTMGPRWVHWDGRNPLSPYSYYYTCKTLHAEPIS